MVLTDIKPGSAAAHWNFRSNPSQAIHVGDIILSVNDKTEQKDVYETMHASLELQIALTRPIHSNVPSKERAEKLMRASTFEMGALEVLASFKKEETEAV